MSQTAEHDVRRTVELVSYRLCDMGMVVAVAGSPPGGDAVDQYPSVRQKNAAALSAHDGRG
jgi:hypothetical protein